ncbi:hypothetical protein LCGC14_2260430 [marine sediment metagenome]|uniref:Uncharacterized protein n=1 Tax=marine sediment metagenome TaxID=412755 RepID=A0A0F9D050_9ZZZZ
MKYKEGQQDNWLTSVSAAREMWEAHVLAEHVANTAEFTMQKFADITPEQAVDIGINAHSYLVDSTTRTIMFAKRLLDQYWLCGGKIGDS